MITKEEFATLPDYTEQYSVRPALRVIDGKAVWVPVFTSLGPLWNEDDEPRRYIDDSGVYWRVGWLDGVQIKYIDPNLVGFEA